MKHYLIILLSLALGCLPMSAGITASGTCGANLTWTLEDEVLTISGTGTMFDDSSSVPWSSNRSQVKSVIINDGVTSIGSQAFAYCGSLTSVTIPESVTHIYANAFDDTHISTIVLPSTIRYIDNEAFSSTMHIVMSSSTPGNFHVGAFNKNSTIYIPKGSMAAYKAMSCYTASFNNINLIEYHREGDFLYNITDVDTRTARILKYLGNNQNLTLPNNVVIGGIKYNVTSVGDFPLVYPIKTLQVPASILSIGTFPDKIKPTIAVWLSNPAPSSFGDVGTVNYTSYGGYNGTTYPYLSSMFTVDGVTYVPTSPSARTCDALYCQYDSDIENVVIPDKVKYRNVEFTVNDVRAYCFSGNSKIRSLTLQNIGKEWPLAFESCQNLQSIVVGNKVTTISSLCFVNCLALESVHIYDRESELVVHEDIFNKCPLVDLYIGGPLAEEARNRPFQGITSLKNLTYRGSGTNINSREFSGCTSLENVSLGEGLKGIDDSGFYGCTSLTSIAVPNSAQNIGESAFAGCKNLSTVTTGAGIKTIGNYAFSSCSSLSNITLYDGLQTMGSYIFSGCCNLSSIAIPSSVTSLGSYAFQNCLSLEEVVGGSGLPTINQYTFKGCKSLQSITLGESVASIGIGAFYGCSKLPAIRIPAATQTVYNDVFNGCTSLANVNIADRTTALSIGYREDSNSKYPLFSQCPLRELYIGGKISYNTSSSYGYSPFYRNLYLYKVTIADSETTIYPYEFYGCTDLTIVEVGDDVNAIGTRAFSGCSSLESFSFGKSVTQIGDEAFSDCTSMTKLVSQAVVPPTCGSQALDDINKWDCTLYVNEESINDYYSAPQWKEFLFIGENNDEISTISVAAIPAEAGSGSVTGSGKYKKNDEVVLTAIPAEGYRFIKWSDGSTQNPYVFNAVSRTNLIAIFDKTSIRITDGVILSALEEKRYESVTYTRNFSEKNAGHWQAWYVPFDLNPVDYGNYRFAQIYMVAYVDPITHALVSDKSLGELSIVIKYLENNELVKAGIPYVIKTNQTGEQTFESVDGVLHAVSENHTIASSTTSEVFTFSGNYESITCPAGWYAVAAGGGFIAAEGKTLNPYRWHFEVTPTGYGSNVDPTAVANARMYVMDEDNELTTSILNMQAQKASSKSYDIQGRLLNGKAAQRGVFIQAGKKYVR